MTKTGAYSGSVLAVLSRAAAAQPDTAEPVLSTTSLLETAGGLVLVLILILGLAWMVRRFGRFPGMAQGAVQVLGGVSLGPREKAILLSVHGMRLLVGVAPGNIRTLHVIGEDASQAPLEDSAVRDFEQTLQRAKRLDGES